MPFPVIETAAAQGFTATGTTDAPLPANIAAGDLLIMFCRCATTGAIGMPAGWNQILQDSSDGSTGPDVSACFWRKATGSEGATVSVTHGAGKSAYSCLRISGAMDPTVQPPQLGFAVGSSTQPDPPSLSPTGGAKAYLWIAFAGIEMTINASINPAGNPSGEIGQINGVQSG